MLAFSTGHFKCDAMKPHRSKYKKAKGKVKSYYREYWSGILNVYWDMSDLIYKGRTKYQNILIGKNPYLGTFLALDGKMQSSEWDEYIYHEALTHTALVTAYPAKRVLIIGGGEGCITREVLKYPSIEWVEWVDIDGEVVRICREKLPYSWKGNDSRVHLEFEDGFNFLVKAVENKKEYDAVLLDLTEHSKRVPLSNRLFGLQAIKLMKKVLSPRGVLVTACLNVMEDGSVVRANIPPLIDKLFKYKRPLHFFVPAFLSEYRLVLATDRRDPLRIPKAEIRSTISSFVKTLRYYDDTYHYNIITLPRQARFDGEKTF